VAIEILQGDWVECLRKLPAKHFHCAVTSPPYWGLRNYGMEGQLGLEKTPEEYVAKLVAGFREMRRTLREDGTFWLNLGDSYAGSGKGAWENKNGGQKEVYIPDPDSPQCLLPKVPAGLKPKDLVGIPWMVAFALRADGWYLRQWMPWVKRNPMPESVTDRPGSACEMVFLLSKTDRYFYDAEAVKMPGRIPAGTLGAKGSAERSSTNGVNSRPPEYKVYSGKRNRRNSDNFWDTWQGMLTDDNGDPLAMVVNTYPYKKAHFATFPPKLVEPIIKSATSEKGCCMECGAPLERVISKPVIARNGVYEGSKFNGSDPQFSHTRLQMMVKAGRESGLPHDNPQPETITIGFNPACDCHLFTSPCRVLDPFGGSGTVGQVCNQLGRDCTLIELNPEYVTLAKERCGV
jgi:DNA modification methylase